MPLRFQQLAVALLSVAVLAVIGFVQPPRVTASLSEHGRTATLTTPDQHVSVAEPAPDLRIAHAPALVAARWLPSAPDAAAIASIARALPRVSKTPAYLRHAVLLL